MRSEEVVEVLLAGEKDGVSMDGCHIIYTHVLLDSDGPQSDDHSVNTFLKRNTCCPDVFC